MECKNNWYLISVTREYVSEIGMTFLVCIYSNGMTEKQIECQHGKPLPTILSHE
jgi:hypothetical protein